MQRIIDGIAPEFFAVYRLNDGTSFLKIQDEISMFDFDEYEHEHADIKRIELFKNGDENLAPEQIDRLDKE